MSESKNTPLAPEGVSYENLYTLQAPFGPQGKASTAVSPVRCVPGKLDRGIVT